MQYFTLNLSGAIPETLFSLCTHLGFSDQKKANFAWLELSGAVLNHYEVDQQKRFNRLLDWFYNQLCFSARTKYYSYQAADLGHCFLSRQGNSTTLAVALMLLGKQLDLPFELLFLPNNTILSCRLPKQRVFIDPLTGNLIDKAHMHSIVKGELGNAAAFTQTYLNPVSNERLYLRVLHELKAGAVVAHKYEAALKCCNLLLEIDKNDFSVHRERAFIAQQLGAIHVASADLQCFIDNSPHDPVIELVKIQLKELDDKGLKFH